MDVLKNNFHELLPTITEAIQGADFIALDTELTGKFEQQLLRQVKRVVSGDNGIPYLNHTEEAKLLQKRADIAQRQTGTNEKQLKISTPHISQKRLIFQEIRASKPKCIVLEKLSDEQKEKYSQNEAAEALAASINFRVILELLVQSKKPLVGHNCLLDICQIVHQFWQDLPEKLKEWKNILEIVQEEQFEKLAPKVGMPIFTSSPILDPRFTQYTFNDENKNHEAGYDAYITGYNFIRIAVFILHEKEEKIDVYANVLGDGPTNGLPNELPNEDMETDPEQTEENEMNLFQYMMSTEKLTHIFFQWIDDTHCWLTVKSDKKVNKVPNGILGQSKMFSEFLEGGKKYSLAQEKGITKEMGEIYIRSFGDWIQEIIKAEEEDENEIEPQDSDNISVDGIKDETYDNIVEEIEFEYNEPFSIPRDELSTWGSLKDDWNEDNEDDNAIDTSSGWGQPPTYPSDSINTSAKHEKLDEN
ncbi:5728_t:CDS:10 [Racocetra fulgida]|uniref:5728_t:CDS:1 n=1 Tax=Racocetra fulgida TaxID=60492 RepID=A0A9N9F9B3_9GLOM|nr:5728_t:CDS:10 [Racocetra fulgida]